MAGVGRGKVGGWSAWGLGGWRGRPLSRAGRSGARTGGPPWWGVVREGSPPSPPSTSPGAGSCNPRMRVILGGARRGCASDSKRGLPGVIPATVGGSIGGNTTGGPWENGEWEEGRKGGTAPLRPVPSCPAGETYRPHRHPCSAWDPGVLHHPALGRPRRRRRFTFPRSTRHPLGPAEAVGCSVRSNVPDLGDEVGSHPPPRPGRHRSGFPAPAPAFRCPVKSLGGRAGLGVRHGRSGSFSSMKIPLGAGQTGGPTPARKFPFLVPDLDPVVVAVPPMKSRPWEIHGQGVGPPGAARGP